MKRIALVGVCLAIVGGAGGASCVPGASSAFPKRTAWSPAVLTGSVGVRPQPVLVADMNADNRLDVVVGYRGSGATAASVAIFFQGDGLTFNAVQISTGATFTGMSSIAVGDIDGDGQQDIIAGVNGQIVYLRATGDPTVATNWTSSVIDGSTGAGLGTWADVALANVDGTGALDIVAANSGPGRASWFRSPATPTSGTGWTRFDIDATTRLAAAAVAVEDIDGDGALDVYSTAPGEAAARVAWYKNPGGDSTAAWSKFTIGNIADATRLAIGDLNKDSRPDVVVTNPTDGQIGWYARPGNPTGTWTGTLLTQYDLAVPLDIETVDVDGNGQVDVVATSSGPATLRWFTPVGAQTTQWVENNLADLADAAARRIAIADIDGDGKPDVIATRNATDPANDQVAWYKNPG